MLQVILHLVLVENDEEGLARTDCLSGLELASLFVFLFLGHCFLARVLALSPIRLLASDFLIHIVNAIKFDCQDLIREPFIGGKMELQSF
jgi:hypothetical protein